MMALILLATGSSLAFLKSNDDIRNLQSMDAALKQEDQYIRSRFMQQQSSEYFVVQGRTPAELEQHEQQLLAKLTPLQQAGKLDAVQALGQWIPSLEQQKTQYCDVTGDSSARFSGICASITTQCSGCFKLASAFKRPTVIDRSSL